VSPIHRPTHRQSTCLRDYDYTQAGAYFITLVTHNRMFLFGEIVNDNMVLSAHGRIALSEWFKSSEIRQEIKLHHDEFVIMPNHIHGIVWIASEEKSLTVDSTRHSNITGKETNLSVRAHGRAPLQADHTTFHRQPKSLSSFVAGYKAAVTKRINQLRYTPSSPVWNRNYHDRIIRNDRELNAIREYIRDNPLRWELDRENPKQRSPSHHP